MINQEYALAALARQSCTKKSRGACANHDQVIALHFLILLNIRRPNAATGWIVPQDPVRTDLPRSDCRSAVS